MTTKTRLIAIVILLRFDAILCRPEVSSSPCTKILAVDGREIPNIERRHRKPVIGQQYSVCCQGLLPIRAALHRSKHLLAIAPHQPACSTGRFGQAHAVKDARREASCWVRRRAVSLNPGSVGFRTTSKYSGPKSALGFDASRMILRSSDVNLDSEILAPLRLCRIELSAKSKLASA